MKALLIITAILLAVLSSPAQTNEPVKMAIIAKSPEASEASDILTAQLSANDKVRLLERNEIEKVYQEQGMSAENRDDLKLGRLLGADGILLIGINVISNNTLYGPKPVETNLTVRLIAVKPGVILADEKFSAADLVGWANEYANHFDTYLPKLEVNASKAIPISLVNLRSSVQSDQEAETEKELKELALQRLSQEQQFFVLEREEMQQLGEEKELNADESKFWDGSYLLEGTVDQNGYSVETITIDARLTPPKGGVPLTFEVSGSRTNLAEVVNELADKVTTLLKVQSTAPEWSAADEASKFFDEAKWALKWKSYAEAEESADSAWALGERSRECAQIRIMAYLDELPEILPPNMGINSYFVHITDPPDEKECDAAISALECYYDFSRTSTEGIPKMLYHGPDDIIREPTWYLLGMNTLVEASKVLQHYYYNPQSQPPVAGKLETLRALTRSVAELISKSPTIYDSYFVGNNVITPDQLGQTFSPAWVSGLLQMRYPKQIPNIFECTVEWGPFWQERPEDDIELYRELMASPLFFCLHDNFWQRQPYCPQLIGWSATDQKRIPTVWSSFINELEASTNCFFRFEGEALVCAEARDEAWAGKDPDIVGSAELADADEGWKNSRDKLLDFISKNYSTMADDNGNLIQNGWGMDYLLGEKSEYSLKFASIQQAYIEQHSEQVKEINNRAGFEKQKIYLSSFTPYDWNTFNTVFLNRDYTKEEATELKPLMEAYKSNILAKASNSTGMDKFNANNNAHWIDFYLGSSLDKILNPPATMPKPTPSSALPPAIATTLEPGTHLTTPMPPIFPTSPAMTTPVSSPLPQNPTNILTVTTFIKIPFEQLSNDGSGIQIFAERWSEGELLAGLEYHNDVYKFDSYGNWQSTSVMTESAIAIFNPTNETWTFVQCPEIPGGNPRMRALENDTERLILFQGDLYSCVDGPPEKYDFLKQEWKTLDVPGADKASLFAVNGHLYAANDDGIFEITENGSTHILASTRRQPAVTALDSLDSFHAVQLFAGPSQSLCASIGKEIYQWDGDDWHDILTVDASQPPEIFDEAIVFRSRSSFGSDDPSRLWIWTKGSLPPELCLTDKPKPHPGTINSPFRRHNLQNLHPYWRSLDGEYLASSPAVIYQTNLYIFVDHSDIKNVNGQRTVVERDGYHAKLVYLSPDVAEPIVIPLRFDPNEGQPPSGSLAAQATPWMAMDSALLNPVIHFSDNQLFFCERNLDGIWSIHTPNLESAIAVEKQVQLSQMAQDKAAAEKARMNFLAKYDLNHNGVIDPEEKEAALDDPNFIKAELDLIDTNHNGILDPEELAYFDVNHGRYPSDNEEAGIEITERLLAERLMKQFDANGDGVIERPEFENLQAAINSSAEFQTPFLPPASFFMYQNTNGVIDIKGLTDFLKKRTLTEIERSGALRGQMVPPSIVPWNDWDARFDEAVNTYWHSPRMLKPGQNTP